MKQRYWVKSRPEKKEFVDVVKESEGGYKIRRIQQIEGEERVREEFIGRSLFEICIKTGYLYTEENAAFAV